jgi:hypothetical protein
MQEDKHSQHAKILMRPETSLSCIRVSCSVCLYASTWADENLSAIGIRSAKANKAIPGNFLMVRIKILPVSFLNFGQQFF